MANEFYVEINGEQKGPFMQSHILDMIVKGELRGDSLMWHDGMTEWAKVSTVPEVYSHIYKPLSVNLPQKKVVQDTDSSTDESADTFDDEASADVDGAYAGGEDDETTDLGDIAAQTKAELERAAAQTKAELGKAASELKGAFSSMFGFGKKKK